MLGRVELPGPQLTISAVGFGCGGLMQSPSRKERMAVLGSAVDNGMTHFDTARMYGLGMAEAELGAFLRTVDRGSVTIATKFGIEVGGMAQRLARFQAPPARHYFVRRPACGLPSRSVRRRRPRAFGCTTPQSRRAASTKVSQRWGGPITWTSCSCTVRSPQTP